MYVYNKKFLSLSLSLFNLAITYFTIYLVEGGGGGGEGKMGGNEKKGRGKKIFEPFIYKFYCR